MDGTVELTGHERQRRWLVGLNVFALLEAAIDLTSFGCPQEQLVDTMGPLMPETSVRRVT